MERYKNIKNPIAQYQDNQISRDSTVPKLS